MTAGSNPLASWPLATSPEWADFTDATGDVQAQSPSTSTTLEMRVDAQGDPQAQAAESDGSATSLIETTSGDVTAQDAESAGEGGTAGTIEAHLEAGPASFDAALSIPVDVVTGVTAEIPRSHSNLSVVAPGGGTDRKRRRRSKNERAKEALTAIERNRKRRQEREKAAERQRQLDDMRRTVELEAMMLEFQDLLADLRQQHAARLKREEEDLAVLLIAA